MYQGIRPDLLSHGKASHTARSGELLRTVLTRRDGSTLSRMGSEPRPGVLLDRDGTIIVDHGHVGSVDRVDFIDGAPQAISRLNRAQLPVAVVTNQAGVAKGFYGLEDVEEVHRY